MGELDYEQTVELEKNIGIKNKANKIYNDFFNNVTLKASSFKAGEFKCWSDSHNRTYITIVDNIFIFHCRFLHESYDLVIDPARIFDCIKNEYRGLGHLESFIYYNREAK